MILPEWYEPINDNEDPNRSDSTKFHFQTAVMDGLYNVLDFAQEEHIDVTLAFWGTRSNTFLLPEKWPGWMMGPSNYEEWAENISVCLHYLLEKKHYTCIKEVTPVNEPDWSFVKKDGDRTALYIQMCTILDGRLRREGLRNKIRLSLSDNSDSGTGTHHFLAASIQGLANEADIFNSHTYIFGYETPNSRILRWERENVRLTHSVGKKHFVGEYGSNQTVGATIQRDIDRYERGILMARIVINLLNAGACGGSYWSLLDQYYSKGEAMAHNNMQQLGLWRHLKEEYAKDAIYTHLHEDYQIRPQYYALGLLFHTITKGSRVFPIESGSEWIAATALKDGKSQWHYIMANPTDKEKEIQMLNPYMKGNKSFHIYLYQESSLPADDSMITTSDEIKTERGQMVLRIPPRSLMVLSE